MKPQKKSKGDRSGNLDGNLNLMVCDFVRFNEVHVSYTGCAVALFLSATFSKTMCCRDRELRTNSMHSEIHETLLQSLPGDIPTPSIESSPNMPHNL
ncbi:hypothetical protein AVEN_257984-1 [Araneus ventricosus]|uniref:Uncharacterized protein n=1 Tax=Araneus ventricosus TaxID=182803 RepID=A0A4Y2K6W1_ARAVE|nr:hypothetical protein AVEN_257984-1 [Araneus ventricosus]